MRKKYRNNIVTLPLKLHEVNSSRPHHPRYQSGHEEHNDEDLGA